jgi:hypothetical protein
MTTYNLLLLDKAIQHHYESTEVIRPTQEEVETALRYITIELQDLKHLNAELLITLKGINNILKGSPVVDESDMIQILNKINTILLGTLNTVERHMR